MTTHEIIDYIAGYYNLGNRSVVEEKIADVIPLCVYNGSGGKHCAFALMCINPQSLIEGQGARDLLHTYGDSILKPEFRGHPFRFYDDIQSLHDRSGNWTETGLSEEGEEEVAALKLKYPIKQ